MNITIDKINKNIIINDTENKTIDKVSDEIKKLVSIEVFNTYTLKVNELQPYINPYPFYPTFPDITQPIITYKDNSGHAPD